MNIVRRARESAGISQKDLARMAKLHPTHLCRIEKDLTVGSKKTVDSLLEILARERMLKVSSPEAPKEMEHNGDTLKIFLSKRQLRRLKSGKVVGISRGKQRIIIGHKDDRRKAMLLAKLEKIKTELERI